MAKPIKDLTPKVMLDQLEYPRKDLTKWEEDFRASVAEQYEQRGELSERQEEVLRKIWAEKA